MATITFKGKPVQTNGQLPTLGEHSPNFSLVNNDLEEVVLEDFGGKKKVLNIFPSLDTGVCASSVRNFHKLCKDRDDVVVLNISMDLPFASGRFCSTENLDNCQTLSAFRSSFPDDYGIMMTEGPLAGLCSRAVVVIGEDNKVLYTEQVPEITQEPSYEKAIEAL